MALMNTIDKNNEWGNRIAVTELAEALGFKLVTPNKNPHMVSFYKEESFDPRINVYYTRMTVQIQWKDGKFEIIKNVTMSQLEDILNKI